LSSSESGVSGGGAAAAGANSGGEKDGLVRPVEMHLTVQVNREWERLFGYTQAELRALIMKDGLRALYRLTRVDSQRSLHRTSLDALLAGSTDFRYYSILVSKWQAEVSCLVHTRIQLQQRQQQTSKAPAATSTPKQQQQPELKGFMLTWSPLPDPRPAPLQQSSGTQHSHAAGGGEAATTATGSKSNSARRREQHPSAFTARH